MDATFINYISSLGYQAMIFMGQSPDPVTRKCRVNLKQAKLLIDTLDMLKKKTEGNLTQEESQLLFNINHELHLKYLEVVNQSSPETDEPKD